MAVVKNHAVKQTVEYITDGSTKNQGKGKKDSRGGFFSDEF